MVYRDFREHIVRFYRKSARDKTMTLDERRELSPAELSKGA